MPFSGFLVVSGQFTLWQVTIIGALGNLAGSLLAYWVGYKGGRPLVEKYGKYILINHQDLDKADHFFTKYGELTAFFSRVLPIVRTFISLPAGIAKMNVWKFSFYTFLGALPFSYFLAWAGVQLGTHWDEVRGILHRFNLAIAVLIVLFLAWWIFRHFANSNIKNQKAK
jgi:membrane protein DedA with SNARE-associated domain